MKKTIFSIVSAVQLGKLSEPFTARAVNELLNIDYANVFLPKHRVGNPGGYTELFVRVNRRPALYRLHTSHEGESV